MGDTYGSPDYKTRHTTGNFQFNTPTGHKDSVTGRIYSGLSKLNKYSLSSLKPASLRESGSKPKTNGFKSRESLSITQGTESEF